MRRILYFLATNIAVLLVLGIVLRLLGVESYLDRTGTGLDYWNLLVFAAVFGMGGSFISLLLSKWMALRMSGAHVISEPRGDAESWLVQTVAHHAQAAGIGMPQVAIFDSPDPNAFATGARRDAALVAVSTGLLRGMTRDEVDAVIGHEISHVANGDMVTLTLIQGVVNTFVLFLSRVVGDVVDRAVFRKEGEGHGPAFFVISIVAQLVLGILASIVVMWFSRQREFRADAGGARLAGRQKMIAALERLKKAPGEPLPDQMAAFGISGGVRSGFARLLMTHPPLDERIERLRAGTGVN
jgi:heat shock protein HtpX